MWYHLVGTSHVAREAITKITAAFETFEPDVVAVELDKGRLQALASNRKPDYSLSMLKTIGIRGYLFAVIGGWMQRKLGKIVGMNPGADMLAAVKEAGKHGKPVLLIDRDIAITLRRLSKALGFRELFQLFKELFRRERIKLTLDKVPNEVVVEKLLQVFRTRYPRPYKVLVTERNAHLARSLKKYHEQHPDHKVLVVVGAGHVQGLEGLLQ